MAKTQTQMTTNKVEAANIIKMSTGFDSNYEGKTRTLWVKGQPESEIIKTLNMTTDGFTIKVAPEFAKKVSRKKAASTK